MNEFSLYDSFLKDVTQLDISKDKTVRWYSCGPTIYDSAHLGHARNFIVFDTIRRVLSFYGYSVDYVMNITDIDDKIINKVNTLKCDYYEFTKKMEQDFWSDMSRLGVQLPTAITRVTEFIPNIIEYIKTIISNGYAYESNGSVYFHTEKAKKDGFNLSPLIPEVDTEYTESEYTGEKKSIKDFVLWKKVKDGEIYFESPWGNGRPGWHIECSAMVDHLFKDGLDIHTGGIDLKFPHHTNEIVQANAYTNDPSNVWVKHFIHCGHLNIDGLKMAKSLKNFISIKHYLDCVGTARELRILFLLHSFEKPMDYSENTLEGAKFFDKKIDDFLSHITFAEKEIYPKSDILEADKEYLYIVNQTVNQIDSALKNNFNTPEMFSVIHSFINKTYIYLENDPNLDYVLLGKNKINKYLSVVGLNYDKKVNVKQDKFVDLAVNFREKIRATIMKHRKVLPKEVMKDIFCTLDRFRDESLPQLGIKLEDRSGKTTKWCYID